MPNPPASCPVKTNAAVSINDNLDARFKQRQSTYVQNPPVTTKQISHFSNMNNDESEFIKKLTKKNKDIENVAIAFVTVIILLFLLVIFNSIRNKSGLATK
jgi:cell division protein FtsX